MLARFALPAALILFAVPAAASPCTDRLDALEARVDAAADEAVATSSSGQGVAAAREGQAMQAQNQGEPVTPATVPPFQDERQETQATLDAVDAGGDRVMQARAGLNEARTLDGDGDSAGCMAKATEIEAQLAPQ